MTESQSLLKEIFACFKDREKDKVSFMLMVFEGGNFSLNSLSGHHFLRSF